ncbi:AraC family transcriptional regulator [Mucilaginibacter sp. HMF5004]|uniref:helix-turn-helix transcriptional regulator n=1 Tax=Mucilaginibacter rivuli TaxID=2857527 RepID=UPI001C5EBF7B|nr:AraC family transcriptional regulator [Mucilaginibacter rivuli]MBW4891689.1 AraC family transcriptional regulator [Mucilaginibacter rivuli]
MDYSKTLTNNNKILCETREHRYQIQCTDDFTLKFALSGNEVYRLGRRELSIYPDSFLILNKGTQYTSKIDSQTPVEVFSIAYDQNFLNDFNNAYANTDSSLLDNPVALQTDFNETIYPFKGDMKFNITHLKNNIERGLQDELLINEYLHHSLINYHRIYQSEIFNKSEKLAFTNKKTRVEIMRRLNSAKEYMYTNYNKNVLLEDLAQHSCLSVNHLLRTFKQAFNSSPHQFLTQLRLQRAQLLLRGTEYSINDIVCMVGFECPSSFIRLFKNKYKTTPMKFRKLAA